MTTLVETRKLTVADFHRMDFADDDPYLYELIDGELVQRKANAPRHQLVLGELVSALHQFTETNQLGEVLLGPVDVFLDDNTSPQPDLVFVAEARRTIITDDGVMGAPDLVVEVISPSSVFRDRVTKKALYERFGVAEYWLIDPADEFIEIYGLQNNRYELLGAASPLEGELVSAVLPGISLNLPELFR
jgi:Uma2 family endonuclease